MIDRTIHIVWVGDERRLPQECVDSWKRLNPSFQVRIWGNRDLRDRAWLNMRHIREMWGKELNGVADIMRYEILYDHGGFAVDADSLCVRPLEDWLFETGDFSCWSNEHHLPGLLAPGYMGMEKGSPLMAASILAISQAISVIDQAAWITTGNVLFTEAWHRHQLPLTVWPSYFFIPEHHSGPAYTGKGPIFARQLFASTRGAYERIASMSGQALSSELDQMANPASSTG